MKAPFIARPQGGDTASSRFKAAKALARLLAESDKEHIAPEPSARIDLSSACISPERASYSAPERWHDCGISPGECLEIPADRAASFIFAKANPFDRCDQLGKNPCANVRDDHYNEMICRTGCSFEQLNEQVCKAT